MEPVTRLELKPGETIDLRQRNMHIMLTGLKRALKEGDAVKLELVFEKAGKVEAEAAVGELPLSIHLHEQTAPANP
jgi:copper(I)-binding protein